MSWLIMPVQSLLIGDQRRKRMFSTLSGRLGTDERTARIDPDWAAKQLMLRCIEPTGFECWSVMKPASQAAPDVPPERNGSHSPRGRDGGLRDRERAIDELGRGPTA